MKIILLIVSYFLLQRVAAQEERQQNNSLSLPPLSELSTDSCKVIYIDGYKYLQRDFTRVLAAFYHTEPNDSSLEAKKRRKRLAAYNKPHPSVETLEIFFQEAAQEFDVPVYLLKAIGKHESNWTQAEGPGIEADIGGWGIMSLKDCWSCHTLAEAAALLNLSPKELKENARQNIRGGAALLAKYAGLERKNFTTYEEWIPTLKKISGLTFEDTQMMSANAYLDVLYKGCNSLTLWGERVKIEPQPKNK
jgi:hypothetical protein